ncbi:MAG: PIG-L deacetylase family protein [Acidimicrobiales bacterium]
MVAQLLTADGPFDAPERVLVVVAHPDDIDFGTAGTVASLTDGGTHVAYCLVTSGDAGDDDLSVSQAELAALREGEQTAAGAEVGVDVLHWLRHPDGRVLNSLELRRDISRIIRIERPDVVITQSPERNWDRIYGSHPDHLATAEATIAAVYPDSRNPRSHPELLDEGHEPHTVDKIWVMGLQPNLTVDITDVFDRKISALEAHSSQTAWMGDRLPKMLTEWAIERGERGGLDAGRMGESFRIVNTSNRP